MSPTEKNTKESFPCFFDSIFSMILPSYARDTDWYGALRAEKSVRGRLLVPTGYTTTTSLAQLLSRRVEEYWSTIFYRHRLAIVGILNLTTFLVWSTAQSRHWDGASLEVRDGLLWMLLPHHPNPPADPTLALLNRNRLANTIQIISDD